MIDRRTAVLSLVLSAAVAAVCAPAFAQEAKTLTPHEMKWMDAPPTLPKGAKVTVLMGDPFKPGPFVMRLQAPANYKIPPHWHSQAEELTVVSGTLYLGMGDQMKTKGAHALPAGSFHFLPAKEHHYAYSKGPAVVQINGDGPFDINYLNAADDPTKKM